MLKWSVVKTVYKMTAIFAKFGMKYRHHYNKLLKTFTYQPKFSYIAIQFKIQTTYPLYSTKIYPSLKLLYTGNVALVVLKFKLYFFLVHYFTSKCKHLKFFWQNTIINNWNWPIEWKSVHVAQFFYPICNRCNCEQRWTFRKHFDVISITIFFGLSTTSK